MTTPKNNCKRRCFIGLGMLLISAVLFLFYTQPQRSTPLVPEKAILFEHVDFKHVSKKFDNLAVLDSRPVFDIQRVVTDSAFTRSGTQEETIQILTALRGTDGSSEMIVELSRDAEGNEHTRMYSARRILIGCSNPTTLENHAGVPGSFRALADLDNVVIFTLDSPGIENFNRAYAYWQKVADVTYAEPDYVKHISAMQNAPNDARYSEQWGLKKIRASEGWYFRTDASGVTVAIIDTGSPNTHPDITNNLWTGNSAGGIRIVDGATSTAANKVRDSYGHGSHVAGIIGARGNNSTGVCGVCWRVKILAVNFMPEGEGYTSDAVEGYLYAARNGASFVNCSFTSDASSESESNAIATCASRYNMTFVCAAGNDGKAVEQAKVYPGCYNRRNIICVAATNSSDAKVSSSNYSTSNVDIAAPGSSILSLGKGSGYAYMSGTSMAAPFVVGTLALMKAQAPAEDYLLRIERLYTAADEVSQLKNYVVKARRVNVFNATGNPLYTTDIWDPADDSIAGASVLVPELRRLEHGLHTLNSVNDLTTDTEDYFVFNAKGGSQYSFGIKSENKIVLTLYLYTNPRVPIQSQVFENESQTMLLTLQKTQTYILRATTVDAAISTYRLLYLCLRGRPLPAPITVIEPAASTRTYQSGDTVRITWEADISGKAYAKLYYDGIFLRNIPNAEAKANVPFDWRISRMLPPGDRYQLCLVSRTSSLIFGWSSTFLKINTDSPLRVQTCAYNDAFTLTPDCIGQTVFNARPSIYLHTLDPIKRKLRKYAPIITTKRAEFPVDTIMCQLRWNLKLFDSALRNKYYRMGYGLRDMVPEESGTVLSAVQPQNAHTFYIFAKTRSPDAVLELFTQQALHVHAPEITALDTQMIGDETFLRLSGQYFAGTKSKVYIEYKSNGKARKYALKVYRCEPGALIVRMPAKDDFADDLLLVVENVNFIGARPFSPFWQTLMP